MLKILLRFANEYLKQDNFKQNALLVMKMFIRIHK